MADRYWVGGAGTWDATTTTNWSATSGGAGGASAPTSADNVFFNSASNATAYAVTVGTNANAQDVTIAGPASGNVTITSGATAVINCFGSWTNAATGVVFSTTSGASINFLSTTTGKTITTNNVTWAANGTTFAGVGGGWSLGSAFTNTAGVTVTNGAFSTSASNYALNTGALTASGTATRSISLNASAVAVTAATCVNIANATGLTFNAGTSTITCSNANPIINGNGQTYNNVSFTATGTGTSTIQGANTFNNLTQTTVGASGRRTVVITANQTINGTLTLGAANTSVRRIQVVGTTVTGLGVGTPITLTVATVATLADVDFRDITAAGASGTWSGTRLGNAGGNSNITFAAGVNKYWNLAAGGNWSATAWALTSGGAVAANNFPLAQDTVIIENTGLTTGNTITINAAWLIGTLDASTRTTAFTLASGTDTPIIIGNFNISSVATITGTGVWYFGGVGATQTITTNGDVIPFPINCNGSTTNIVRLVDNLTTTNTVTLQQGTFDLNNNTLTTSSQFSGSGTGVRTIAFGSTGKMDLTGTNATLFTTSVATSLTVTGTNPLIQLTTNATTGIRGVILGAAGESNAISLDVTAGSDQVNLSTTSGAYKNVNFTGFTGTYNANNSILVYGNWNFGGVTATSANGTVTFAATSGTKTVTSNGVTFPANVTFNGIGGTWEMQDALTVGSTRMLTLANGTLKLKSGTTNTVGSFTTSGTNQRYLQSTTPGVQATLSQATGTVSASNLTIQDSNATGGAIFQAFTSNANVNAGNNTGWYFLNSVNFFPFF